MQALVWPMLDNKFLKHPGLGVKLLLPIELEHVIDRQERRFPRTGAARQTKPRPLAGLDRPIALRPGQRPIEGVRRRMGKPPAITDLLDPTIDARRLKDGLATLRVPRHMFKFFYRLFTAHCNAHSDDNPAWHIGQGEFESVLALLPAGSGRARPGSGSGVRRSAPRNSAQNRKYRPG